MIAVPCLTWGCRPCRDAKVKQLIARVYTAKPNAWMTLTTRVEETVTPREQFLWSSRKVSLFAITWRRLAGEFEYIRFVEATEQGWPHFHLICRAAHLKKHWISRAWCQHTGSFIIDFDPITNPKYVAGYCTKYATKQSYLSFTNRRIANSKKFFPDVPHTGKKDPRIYEWKFFKCSPAETLAKIQGHIEAKQDAEDHWSFPLPEGWTQEHALADREAINVKIDYFKKIDEEDQFLNTLGTEIPMPVLNVNVKETLQENVTQLQLST